MSKTETYSPHTAEGLRLMGAFVNGSFRTGSLMLCDAMCVLRLLTKGKQLGEPHALTFPLTPATTSTENAGPDGTRRALTQSELIYGRLAESIRQHATNLAPMLPHEAMIMANLLSVLPHNKR